MNSSAVAALVLGLALGLGLYKVTTFLPFRIEWGSNIAKSPRDALGQQGEYLFKTLDTDEDGKLDAKEFAAVLPKILGEGHIPVKRHSADGEFIQLKTKFTPLIIESMKAGGTDENMPATFLKDERISKGIVSWKKPMNEHKIFNTLDFYPFLPRSKSVEVGKSWYMYRTDKDSYSSDRFYPPVVEGEEEFIVELLRIFHPQPFTRTRFAPQGAVAVVRAQNDEFFDITFRIHAEFQLNDATGFPFWFTPSQFTGNLVISRDFQHIEYFRFFVPNDKNLNVDMEWLTGPKDIEGSMQVDIGYMPQMELESYNPSSKAKPSSVTDMTSKPKQFKWQEEIAQEKADNILEKAFYPFKEVDYLNFPQAFKRAEAENKLVHSIIMWGALDDQSC